MPERHHAEVPFAFSEEELDSALDTGIRKATEVRNQEPVPKKAPHKTPENRERAPPGIIDVAWQETAHSAVAVDEHDGVFIVVDDPEHNAATVRSYLDNAQTYLRHHRATEPSKLHLRDAVKNMGGKNVFPETEAFRNARSVETHSTLTERWTGETVAYEEGMLKRRARIIEGDLDGSMHYANDLSIKFQNAAMLARGEHKEIRIPPHVIGQVYRDEISRDEVYGTSPTDGFEHALRMSAEKFENASELTAPKEARWIFKEGERYIEQIRTLRQMADELRQAQQTSTDALQQTYAGLARDARWEELDPGLRLPFTAFLKKANIAPVDALEAHHMQEMPLSAQEESALNMLMQHVSRHPDTIGQLDQNPAFHDLSRGAKFALVERLRVKFPKRLDDPLREQLLTETHAKIVEQTDGDLQVFQISTDGQVRALSPADTGISIEQVVVRTEGKEQLTRTKRPLLSSPKRHYQTTLNTGDLLVAIDTRETKDVEAVLQTIASHKTHDVQKESKLLKTFVPGTHLILQPTKA